MNDKILNKLLKLLDKSKKSDDFPVSAIIYRNSKIISCGYNRRNKSKMTIDHAEIMAITKANRKLKNWKLSNTCMVVTLEPCEMCKTVIKEARIDKVYYLIERYKYKKQYRCSKFELLKLNGPEIEKYKNDITTFFKDKR